MHPVLIVMNSSNLQLEKWKMENIRLGNIDIFQVQVDQENKTLYTKVEISGVIELTQHMR